MTRVQVAWRVILTGWRGLSSTVLILLLIATLHRGAMVVIDTLWELVLP